MEGNLPDIQTGCNKNITEEVCKNKQDNVVVTTNRKEPQENIWTPTEK